MNKVKSETRNMLLRLLDEAYDKATWHGPNLRNSVRGVTATDATWRPNKRRRNIAEIVVHCAFTKNLVRRRIAKAPKRDFFLKGSNWFELPESLTPSLWQKYLAILHDEHAKLCAALSNAPLASLKTWRVKDNIVGVAFHDVYHAGQIRTLRALGHSFGFGGGRNGRTRRSATS